MENPIDLPEEDKFLEAILYDNTRISEKLFVEKYLNLVFNINTPEDREAWLTVARLGSLPVTVYDHETGKDLFLVPPIDAKCKLEFVQDASFGELQSYIAEQARINPKLGNKTANEILDMTKTKKTVVEEEWLTCWLYIYNRYFTGKQTNGQSSDTHQDPW